MTMPADWTPDQRRTVWRKPTMDDINKPSSIDESMPVEEEYTEGRALDSRGAVNDEFGIDIVNGQISLRCHGAILLRGAGEYYGGHKSYIAGGFMSDKQYGPMFLRALFHLCIF